MDVPKWTPIQAREMLRSNCACCMLHNFCRNVFLNDDDEEEATGDSSNAVEVYQDDINETEEGRQKRDEFVRSFFT